MVNVDWVSEAVSHLPPIATANEVATVLRCSSRHVRRLVSIGRITGVHGAEGGSSRLLVPRASIESYLRGLVSP